MSKPAKAQDFLSKLSIGEAAEQSAEPASQTETSSPKLAQTGSSSKGTPKGRPPKRAGGSRVGLKHLGGYVDDETAEQFALLKIRLKQGNDDLLTLAIGALFRAEAAKRKFGS